MSHALCLMHTQPLVAKTVMKQLSREQRGLLNYVYPIYIVIAVM